MSKKVNGEKILFYRKQRSLTQTQLAEKAGITLRSIQRLEKGSNAPRAYTITKICEALGITLSDLRGKEMLENKGTLIIMALSPSLFLIHPLLSVAAPLAIWLLKKDDIQGADKVGKQILNFELTWFMVNFMTTYWIMGSIFLGIKRTGQIEASTTINQALIFSAVIIILKGINIVFVIWAAVRIQKDLSLNPWPVIPFFKMKGKSHISWLTILLLIPLIYWQVHINNVPDKFSKKEVTEFCENILQVPFTPERTYHDTLMKYFHPSLDSAKRAQIMYAQYIPYGPLPESSIVLQEYCKTVKKNGINHMLRYDITRHYYLLNIVEVGDKLNISFFAQHEIKDEYIDEISLKRVKGSKEWWVKTENGSGVYSLNGIKYEYTKPINILRYLRLPKTE